MKCLKRLSCMVLLGGLLVGCAKPNIQEGLLYTNLKDEETKQQIEKLLIQSKIDQENVKTYMEWVNDFNSRVENPEALTEGYQPMKEGVVDYNNILVTTKQTEDGRDYWEANCRLSAYLLYKDFVNTQKQIEEDAYLMFDLDAIDTMDQFAMSKEERKEFVTLFNPVQLEEDSTLDMHVAKIQEAYIERELVFDDKSNISLITLYLHDPYENKRLVGHAAVLIDTGNELVLIEKYGPPAPYQATVCKTRKEVVEYLLARPDLYGDGSELPPIVMENNQVLTSY